VTPALGVQVRPATPDDALAVAALVAARDLPPEGLDRAWRTWVADHDGLVVGTASLERHDDAVLLRSLAVAADHAGAGIGAQLVEAALQAADGIGPVALLTETAAAWFPRFGFAVTSRDRLPAALAASAQLQHACPASATAMIRAITGPRPGKVPAARPASGRARTRLAVGRR